MAKEKKGQGDYREGKRIKSKRDAVALVKCLLLLRIKLFGTERLTADPLKEGVSACRLAKICQVDRGTLAASNAKG